MQKVRGELQWNTEKCFLMALLYHSYYRGRKGGAEGSHCDNMGSWEAFVIQKGEWKKMHALIGKEGLRRDFATEPGGNTSSSR